MDATAKTFRYLDPDEVAAQRKAAAPQGSEEMTVDAAWLCVCAGVALVLAGCGSSDQEELQQWMTEQRSAGQPDSQPISEPKKFTPQAYTRSGAIEPFSSRS